MNCGDCKFSHYTVYGYPVRELIFFAQMCRRHGITEDELHGYCVSAEQGYRAGADDFHRVFAESLEQALSHMGQVCDSNGQVDKEVDE